MRLRLFGCRRFRKLVSEAMDRDLTDREYGFMTKHREVCQECRQSERQSCLALNMLRSSAMAFEPEPGFDDLVLSRWRDRSLGAGVRYWSPAFLGAAIAGLAVLAALQMISESSKMPNMPLERGIHEARNDRSTLEFPEIRVTPNRPDVQ